MISDSEPSQYSTFFPVVANRRAERPFDNNNPACKGVVKLPGIYVGGRESVGDAVGVPVGSNDVSASVSEGTESVGDAVGVLVGSNDVSVSVSVSEGTGVCIVQGSGEEVGSSVSLLAVNSSDGAKVIRDSVVVGGEEFG